MVDAEQAVQAPRLEMRTHRTAFRMTYAPTLIVQAAAQGKLALQFISIAPGSNI
jgi:hypothetical protein